MLISQLVKETGLTKDTIRFYEKHGLINVGRKERRENNYKEYSPKIKERLLTVKRLKSFGFTLNEVSELLTMIDLNEASCNNIAHKLSEKVNILDEEIRELITIRTMLLNCAKECRTGCNSLQPDDNCQILVSEKRTF